MNNTPSATPRSTDSCKPDFLGIKDEGIAALILVGIIMMFPAVAKFINTSKGKHPTGAFVYIMGVIFSIIATIAFAVVAWDRSRGDFIGFGGRMVFAPVMSLYYAFQYYITKEDLCPHKLVKNK